MKVLLVIHGYPERYNAGSEVYTQSLARELARRHEVHVFTREEDSFAPEYRLRRDHDAERPEIALHVINRPNSRDRYVHEGTDARFSEVLDEVRPDVIHVGHLNHLSTSLVTVASKRGIPIVFTLHDFWLMCPRGQFLQQTSDAHGTPWPLCDGQNDRKCAERCYSRYFGGVEASAEEDLAYWTSWTRKRMAHVREIAEQVDLFIAPSRQLFEKFVTEARIPRVKVVHLPYGFDLPRLNGRDRTAGQPFTFGFIGTHTPAKGIPDLIEAFGRLGGDALLKIWGRPRGADTEALNTLAKSIPSAAAGRIRWMGE